ncbi:MAG TPA: hypothetical protein VMU54_15350, partial [Planctomycetota bacterium]|nr:hypothetical protein [Planctomycetota bacterium]
PAASSSSPSPPSPTPPAAPVMPGPPPMAAHQEFPKEARVGDLPPVTLQLLKQSIMFDNENDSIAAISRTLGIPAEPAAQIRLAILQAFPDLKPAPAVLRQGPRR